MCIYKLTSVCGHSNCHSKSGIIGTASVSSINDVLTCQSCEDYRRWPPPRAPLPWVRSPSGWSDLVDCEFFPVTKYSAAVQTQTVLTDTNL